MANLAAIIAAGFFGEDLVNIFAGWGEVVGEWSFGVMVVTDWKHSKSMQATQFVCPLHLDMRVEVVRASCMIDQSHLGITRIPISAYEVAAMLSSLGIEGRPVASSGKLKTVSAPKINSLPHHVAGGNPGNVGCPALESTSWLGIVPLPQSYAPG
ncbi:hypothetical protein J008_03050 [Cryptococcus neoformans]|nr:hypothetical protein J008_03050 [Cryptococcus neoformans var. grubii]